MKYPVGANGDVFRRMEASGFDFSVEHTVDFHAVLATVKEAEQIARLYVADHEAGFRFSNIETKPYPEGGMELTLSRRMLVKFEDIQAMEDTLQRRVSLVEGYLDGWGVLQE